jgi:hypothetical protein
MSAVICRHSFELHTFYSLYDTVCHISNTGWFTLRVTMHVMLVLMLFITWLLFMLAGWSYLLFIIIQFWTVTEPFKIGPMFIWTFLLRTTHTIISRSIADSSWITLYLGTQPSGTLRLVMGLFCFACVTNWFFGWKIILYPAGVIIILVWLYAHTRTHAAIERNFISMLLGFIQNFVF